MSEAPKRVKNFKSIYFSMAIMSTEVGKTLTDIHSHYLLSASSSSRLKQASFSKYWGFVANWFSSKLLSGNMLPVCHTVSAPFEADESNEKCELL